MVSLANWKWFMKLWRPKSTNKPLMKLMSKWFKRSERGRTISRLSKFSWTRMKIRNLLWRIGGKFCLSWSTSGTLWVKSLNKTLWRGLPLRPVWLSTWRLRIRIESTSLSTTMEYSWWSRYSKRKLRRSIRSSLRRSSPVVGKSLLRSREKITDKETNLVRKGAEAKEP